jgi:hypothetical protein
VEKSDNCSIFRPPYLARCGDEIQNVDLWINLWNTRGCFLITYPPFSTGRKVRRVKNTAIFGLVCNHHARHGADRPFSTYPQALLLILNSLTYKLMCMNCSVVKGQKFAIASPASLVGAQYIAPSGAKQFPLVMRRLLYCLVSIRRRWSSSPAGAYRDPPPILRQGFDRLSLAAQDTARPTAARNDTLLREEK